MNEVPPALTIGRRSFLRQAMTVVAVAPIVGLLDQRAVVAAGAETAPSQPFGYASGPLVAYEHDLNPMLDSILKALSEGRIHGDVATRLVHSLLDVLIAAADKATPSPSGAMQAFVLQVKTAGAAIPDGLARELLNAAEKHI